MTAGRKPKPTALKIISGNAGKRPLPTNEAFVPSSEPAPPPFLSDDAKVEWGRLVSTLFSAGLISEIDRAVFAAYCQSYVRWAQAERELDKLAEKGVLNSILMKTTNGNAIQHVLLWVANKAHADMVRYASEFGMTPSARTRVDAKPQALGNPFAKNGKRDRA